MSDSLSNTFQQRRQLAIAVTELSQTEDGRSLALAARAIYDAYADDLIQAELLRQLETPDSQLRGGLGELAALLPRERIGTALRVVAADRTQSAQRRLTAAMLASQYLHQSIPAALLSDLSDGNEVAFQSLLDAVEEGKHNRHVLLEYVLQMRQAGDHVPPMVLDLLSRLPETDRIELLRLVALDDREGVALNALGRLETLTSSTASEAALRALHTLQFMLRPDLASFAQDALRRQRFLGNVYRPPQPAGWRALLSICDLMGNQALWFVYKPAASQQVDAPAEEGVILALTLNNHTGEIDALVDEEILDQALPPQQSMGQTLPVETTSGRPVLFQEVPFDVARWRVLELLPANWETAGELAPEFRLYGDRIWEFAYPETPANLSRFFTPQSDATSEDSGEKAPPVPSATDILGHPAMAQWLRYNQSTIVSYPEEVLQVPLKQRAALIHAMLVQIEQHMDAEFVTSSVAAALRAQAAWFELAGEAQAANVALRLAELTPQTPLSRNPLLAALLEMNLSEATNNLSETDDGESAVHDKGDPA
ncbi:MAG: hypothetical protein ACK2UO_14470 [Caldilineaceae bacterium]